MANNIHFGECIIPIDGKTIKEINDEIALAQQSVKMDGQFKQQLDKATLVRIILQYNKKHYLIGVGFIPSNVGPQDGRYELYHQEGSQCVRGFMLLDTQPPTELNTDLGLTLYNQAVSSDLMEAKNSKIIRKIAIHTGDAIGMPGAFSCNDLGNGIDKMFHLKDDSEDKTIIQSTKPNKNESDAHNIILSGPPGVGKSFIVANNIIPKLIPNRTEQITNVERITITPSTTFEDFFGCYKPQMKGENIKYDFSEGIFSRLLKKALNSSKEDEKFVLVVEELNRADVYDVFGQVFQLLDRNKNGESSSPISTPKDALEYFDNSPKLYIPKNMYIICTMNSADQGVHMLDTAFKRRFEMVYVDIKGNVYAAKNIPLIDIEPATIPMSDLSCKQYHDVRQEINERLKKDDITEDKLIAEYFIKTDHKHGDLASGRDVSSIEFIVKVLGYLLQNVYKTKPTCDEIFNADLKRQGGKNSEITLWQLLQQDSWKKILNADIAKIITNKEE